MICKDFVLRDEIRSVLSLDVGSLRLTRLHSLLRDRVFVDIFHLNVAVR